MDTDVLLAVGRRGGLFVGDKRGPRGHGKPLETTSLQRSQTADFASCEPYATPIAVLRLATLHGYSDPRFIATLGGMLFLDGKFTEADEVFAKSLKLGLAAAELHRIEFKPHEPRILAKPMRLKGSVAAVKFRLGGPVG